MIETTQVPVPAHPPPDHPANEDPADGVALNATEAVGGFVKLAEAVKQAVPQLIPAGDEMTVPVPVPALLTVTV